MDRFSEKYGNNTGSTNGDGDGWGWRHFIGIGAAIL